MSETPEMIWQHLIAQNSGPTLTAFRWCNPGLVPGPPPAASLPAGFTLKAGVVTLASDVAMYPFTASCAAGQQRFSVLSGFSNLQAGMWVAPTAPGILPNGLQIWTLYTVDSSLLLAGVGGSPPVGGAFTATVSVTPSTPLYAVDEYPYGTLTAAVTPSTGVTIEDWNFDGANLPDPLPGNGSAMSNSGGQADAGFAVTFSEAGEYTIEVSYESADPAYSNTSSSCAVTVT